MSHDADYYGKVWIQNTSFLHFILNKNLKTLGAAE